MAKTGGAQVEGASPRGGGERRHVHSAIMSLFKKMDVQADLGTPSALKSAVQRGIRTHLLEQYADTLGADEGALLEKVWPKKDKITTVKFKREHVTFVVHNGKPIFFQHYDGPWLPTLHLLQQYPCLLPSVQVDRGAIRFLVSGANVMSPGLTSAGGRLPNPEQGERALDKGAAVAIRCQGKDTEVAVGVLQLSTEEIRKKGKGIGIDNVHYLGDDLWMLCAKETL